MKFKRERGTFQPLVLALMILGYVKVGHDESRNLGQSLLPSDEKEAERRTEGLRLNQASENAHYLCPVSSS